jgi:phospholipase C
MFENRSFDHMLGGMPGVNGVLLPGGTVNPAYYNTMSPTTAPDAVSNPPLLPTPIDLSGQAGLAHDFNHDFGDGMMPDLFGPGCTGYVNGAPVNAPATTYPATNSGFLSTIANNVDGDPPNGPSVLYFFEHGSLKVFHQLASEFVVCDNWHCDLPGHTKPNRCYMHCATSGNIGIDDNNGGTETTRTIYNQVEEMGYDWKMYTPGGWLDSIFLEEIINSPNTNIPISQFCTDVEKGTLPFYSFLMPGLSISPDTSMHPASRVEPGENYLAAIYNTLRNSQYWENTLLVVNFDENGGIYDHVMPPQTVSPDPSKPIFYGTNYDGSEAEFDFTLLGPRIPAILISPWLSKGIDSTLFQNTSILRYIQDLIAAPTELFLSLTDRDAKATSISNVFDAFGNTVPRTDCPVNIEGYSNFGGGNICDPDAFKPTAEFLQQAPQSYTIALAKEYIGGLPGHPDSDQPFTKTFASNAELNAYADERIEAAKKYVLARK